MNRDHQPSAEEAVDTAAIAGGDEPARLERLLAVAGRARPLRDCVKAVRRVAQAELVRQRLGKIAALQIGARRFRRRIALQQLVPPRRHRRVQRQQFLTLAARFRVIASVAFRDGDARPLRQPPHRLGERHVFHQHQELEDVAAVPATEALEDLHLRIDVKGRRLLLLERAQGLELGAGFLQRHVTAHHVDDVRGVAHLLDDIGGNHAGHDGLKYGIRPRVTYTFPHSALGDPQND